MIKDANVILLNEDGSVFNSRIVKDGSVNELGKVLNKHYQNEDKTHKLLQWGEIYRIGAKPKISPMMKAFGTEWEKNSLAVREVLGSPDNEDNDNMSVEDENRSYISSQLWKIIKKMDMNYTLPYTYMGGGLKPLNHFNALDRVTPLAHNYLYVPSRARGDKWLYCNIKDTNHENVAPYSERNKNGKLWNDLNARIRELKLIKQ